ncbi:hypothetical protein BDV96DRAFT_590896 [Lophiotrema nucula]|uniref:Uncharacterized protein n=1 Tax=Lophiotrema nucula TaxID=690887 RepID=A0A6A5YH95_9PLEO|nr:hypothetical protein BDV96DRAFT_590896 [Lophiotrema nucula]
MELCIRIWLTINVKSPSIAVGPVYQHDVPIKWTEDRSLQDLIRVRFKKCAASGNPRYRTRLEGKFTAAYLVNVCEMKLHWTDNLTDHLCQDPDQHVFTVYKHKICLLNHSKSKDGCPIPKDVLEEALDTLDLLFPFGDPATKQLLKKENQLVFYQLGNRARDRELDLSRYEYWREELDDLVDSFRKPPRSWKQLATDRRNLMEWAAFWVAVMVAISVKAYHAAIAQSRYSPQN